ncbi:MAG: GNAT family N-acetyltransferase [Lachnospiraceae bacterium]|nr:GNAT family N-acetyltransferase [Lachnospiraceae bacterium]
MIRLRPYKPCDADKIAEWVKEKDTYLKWGGIHLGEYPLSPEAIDEAYRNRNGNCEEPDNFYPWVAFDDENGVVGHFIMRYLNGDNKILRFGWVVIDASKRGSGYGEQMLRAGLKYAFEILGVEKVTIGVYETNDIAHACYKKIGFKEQGITEEEPWNVREMAISKEEYFH